MILIIKTHIVLGISDRDQFFQHNIWKKNPFISDLARKYKKLTNVDDELKTQFRR